MQFLIDENLSPKLATILKELGYVTKSCREVQLLGKKDSVIVEWALKNDAVVITYDREFGEMWYWHYYGQLGIIVLCLSSQSLEGQKKVVEYLHKEKILARLDLINLLVVSTESRCRIRK